VEQFLPLLLIFGVMYLVLIVPQQRKKRQHTALLASLVEGDEVVLNSGIHGFVGQLEETVLWLEVTEGVELKVARSSIAGKVEVPVDSPIEDVEE